jgi:hypothetical protein
LGTLSFWGTIGLLIWPALVEDRSAFIAIILLSLTSSLLGLANLWSIIKPVSARGEFSREPSADLIIHGRQGAFVVVECSADMAQELHTGNVDAVNRFCRPGLLFGALGRISTILFIAAIILLANATWTMQATLAITYGVLHAVYWAVALLPRTVHWDFSSYQIKQQDVGFSILDGLRNGSPTFTRALWLAIRTTREVDWVRRLQGSSRNRYLTSGL